VLGLKPFSIVLEVKGDGGIGHLLRVLVMVDWRLKSKMLVEVTLQRTTLGGRVREES